MDGDHYRYTELDKTRKEIRLLRLITTADGSIAGKLETFDLDDMRDVSYRALSYVWGPKHPTFDILVDGKPLTIRENLYHFLEVAGKDDELIGVRFWIDQICIDQTSISERNHQVSFMADIYQQAEETVVWLGSADDKTEITMKYLYTSVKETRFRDLLSRPKLAHLANNSYWSRVWITQEFILSRALCIMWGDYKVPDEIWNLFWEEIELAYDSIARSWPVPSVELIRLRSLLLLRNFKACQSLESREAPLSVFPIIMNVTNFQKCEDPKDYVFATQSLLPAGDRVIIDYNHSIEDILLSALPILGRSAIYNDVPGGLREDFMSATICTEILARRMLPHLLERHPQALGPFLFGCGEECPKRVQMVSSWEQAVQDGAGEDFLVKEVVDVLEILKNELHGGPGPAACCARTLDL